MEVKPIVKFLGGKKNLKKDVLRIDQLMAVIREGLPFDTVISVSEKLHVGERVLVELISSSARTAARRITDRTRLKEDESDRLLRVVRIANEAQIICGSIDKATQWLQTPIRALGGKTPFSHLDTDLGAAEVTEVLARIDDGIIS
jgi:putative toxin-antitoxin system antitoxin component (TIGR02293 family)